MAYPASANRMSAEAFLNWEEKQSEKHELVQGKIFAMVGFTRRHATIAGNLFRFVGNQLADTGCRVYMADMKLRLEAADAFFYPDVFVTCSDSDHRAERYMTEPRFIAEVLSESTEAYDRGEKFEKYRRFSSLLEYALIDPIRRKTEIFRRDAEGRWVLHEFDADETVHFSSLGLAIEGATLYRNVD